MARNLLVMFPVAEGERLVKALEEDSLDFQAAFWIQKEETEEWSLMIATHLVEEWGPRKVYERIRSVLSKLQPPLENMTFQDIMVISPNREPVRSLRKQIDAAKNGVSALTPAYISVEGYKSDVYIYRMPGKETS
jgi:hypothetical protein